MSKPEWGGKEVAQVKRLYRVYAFWPSSRRVGLLGQSMAVSPQEACSHVRWSIFGKVSKEELFQEYGLEMYSAKAGSQQDEKLATLSGRRKPTKKAVKSSRKGGHQMSFLGLGFGSYEPEPRRH